MDGVEEPGTTTLRATPLPANVPTYTVPSAVMAGAQTIEELPPKVTTRSGETEAGPMK